MTRPDDIITRHGKKDPFFRMYGKEVKQQVKDLMLDVYKESQDLRNHTGIPLDTAFNQKVKEL